MVTEHIRQYETTIDKLRAQVHLSSDEIAKQIASARAAFHKFKESEEFVEARTELLEAYTKERIPPFSEDTLANHRKGNRRSGRTTTESIACNTIRWRNYCTYDRQEGT